MKEFVQYLNSLHRCGGSNVNATAEANLNTVYAKDIIYRDELLISQIINALRTGNHKVLLTGFAGDGKTTLAELISQEISGQNDRLKDDRTEIVDLNSNLKITIIKDLSELPNTAEEKQLEEDLKGSNGLLLVSNTGTVLRKLNKLYRSFDMPNEASMEVAVLNGLHCEKGSDQGVINLGDTSITVFNLVLHDNLDTAYNVFRKILDHPEWENSSEEEKESVVYANVQLLKQNNYHALDRIMLIYRRLYEYGERLTMRNLVEHFSFTVTGNLLLENFYIKSNAYFFDNFFGDSLLEAKSLTAVKMVNNIHLGSDMAAKWKRSIFLNTGDSNYAYIIPEIYGIRNEFENRKKRCESNRDVSRRNRISVMHICFFLAQFSSEQDSENEFICSYLNSPGFEYVMQLRTRNSLAVKDANKLLTKLKKVLRDYYAGFKLSETSEDSSASTIVVTVSRNLASIKQTAQIVQGDFDWKSNTVGLEYLLDSRNQRQIYLRVQKPDYKTADDRYAYMHITLPFLDYLLRCHMGVIGDPAFMTFQKRMDEFKIDILSSYEADENSLSVAYIDLSRKLKRISYAIEDSSSGDVITVGVGE